ncbi:acyl-CoA dehydrogenase family protein [Gordonia sp. Z-3]|jgi:alkylation response protein AidB-like acyl-CoA dehydrogenase|uniref:Acyl-CoA/acyl-ACP dehydrogenase n=2 Tax=Gordonia TaxID=2053 RepID=A0A9X3I5L0_9ACTN|nr:MULTISPECIES: acyl-CoA dehydrogenase family protein [Gordonia]MAU84278.1 acyl-CoA dehydrogenase [Gordonia sp. (in: high G+C Gram-positive bacteria)]MAU84820.1 acyl-CoA dehydrogenase [Gordonia sp. (in: high G+C Gram-positive bacteria)]MCF3937983.1 acyl-CoA/acyl-ACP dehydrogenase [Gordonia tangerina]MCX2965908.1 acyl-CoA/acyl-ACP dehydrogenase [Gordonia aquimaris]MED5800955.1 acyl-CoA dehydrogenase family protein [Gordonia sp. Z-3]
MVSFTDEQTAFAKAVADFCQREAGTRAQRDALTDNGAELHSPELYGKMAALGWTGIVVPEDFGGAGAGNVEMCILLQEAMRGNAPIGGIGPTLITAAAYEKFADEQLKKNVLAGVVDGDSLSISMSEPEAGSDVANLSCRAEKVDGGWVINGQKTWCSNAHFAKSILLIARTEKTDKKHEGLTQFHIPAGTPGLEIKGIDTLGGREVNDLYFTDCEVPDSAVVGEVGNGWNQLMAGLNTERLILAAMQLGVAERSFADTLAFITDRKQFGRPIGTFQALRHRMADLATEIECTRELVYSVARQADDNPTKLLPREASMAKLKATETSKRMTIDAMQMMGGYGYATEFDAERLMRGAIISTVYGGTNEIQRDIIGKTYGL